MRNQYMAKVLVHNKVVSEAQIQAHWGEITDKKDIGQVLVDAGVLQPPVYIKLLAFVKNLEAKAAAENAAAPAAEAPASSTSAKVSAPSMRTMASKPGESSASASDDAGGLQIEGNNPYGETTSTTNMEVETVTGLEATSISTVQVQTEYDENAEDEDDGKLPARFAVATGEGKAVEAPETIRPMTNLSQLIAFARKFNATDIYLFANRPVVMRQSGGLFVASEAVLDLDRINDRLNEAVVGFSDGYRLLSARTSARLLVLRVLVEPALRLPGTEPRLAFPFA